MLERLTPIALLVASNVFMTFAWYGHLKFENKPLWIVIAASWGIAFFEYCLAVPANRYGHSVYNATKAAIRSLVRTAASELLASGIRVNTLSPGPVDTPIIEGQVGSPEAAEVFRKRAASVVPLGRIGRAEELAAAALFLASDESSFSTGTDLVVDGGMTQL